MNPESHCRKVTPWLLIFSLLLVACQSPEAVAPEPPSSDNNIISQSPRNQAQTLTRPEDYLEEYFALTFPSDLLSAQEFTNGLLALGVEEFPEPSSPFTLGEATKLAVLGANLEALALTYSRNQSEKAIERLAFYEVEGINQTDAPWIACALDANLVSATVDFSAELEKTEAVELLYRVAESRGLGRNYLGQIQDPDILSKVIQFYDSFADIDRFSGDELIKMGNSLVLEGLCTGYGLKNTAYSGNFLSDYRIQYSHSDITHVLQVLTLLHSEEMQGYVQLEPKISSFEYLPEWGDPEEITPTPLYQVVEEDGKYFAFALEFDLLLEFTQEEDKAKFNLLIEEYAKKWSENQEEDGSFTPSLLESSWWQPLYLSATPMEDPDSFFPMIEHSIQSGDGYSLQIFALEDETSSFLKQLEENFILEEYAITGELREVNAAFYRYLQGEFE